MSHDRETEKGINIMMGIIGLGSGNEFILELRGLTYTAPSEVRVLNTEI